MKFGYQLAAFIKQLLSDDTGVSMGTMNTMDESSTDIPS